MKPIFLTVLSMVVLCSNNYSQHKVWDSTNKIIPVTTKRCGTSSKLEEAISRDPSIELIRQKIETHTQNWVYNKQLKRTSAASAVITIPVVVHFIYTDASQNSSMTDARIQSQIDVLTQDYRRLNTNASKTPSAFQSVAADTEIEFCLATKDPNGNLTNGITRTKTTVPTIGSTSKYYSTTKGGKSAWDTNSYLNLWVCELGGSTLGFTYPPGAAPNGADGVVIKMDYFGAIGTVFPYNKGRTTTHEVGHWLNLDHVWGDDGGSCTGSDNVSDTPNQADENYGCPSFPQISCNNTPNGDMFMNYMDYTDDACMNLFTQGQRDRMQALFSVGGAREGLKNSQGCTGGGKLVPSAGFTASNTTIGTGVCINFTDLSTGAPATWGWIFTGGLPSTSNDQNPTGICYDSIGCYPVKLIVSNTNGADSVTTVCFINVVDSAECKQVSNFADTDTPGLFSSDKWGYISGHNNYGDLAKADLYKLSSSDITVEGAKIWFAKAFAGNVTTSLIKLSMWDGASGSPGNILGSKSMLVSDLLVYPDETFIEFDVPIAVSNDYFLGIELSLNTTPQDTVALLQNTVGNETAWEKSKNGTWYPLSKKPPSWGISTSFAIWPIQCSKFTTNTSDENSSIDLSVFPNPTSGSFTVKAENYDSRYVKIKVYNLLGNMVYGSELFEKNTINKEINISNSGKGVYFVTVETKNSSIIKKVIVY